MNTRNLNKVNKVFRKWIMINFERGIYLYKFNHKIIHEGITYLHFKICNYLCKFIH